MSDATTGATALAGALAGGAVVIETDEDGVETVTPVGEPPEPTPAVPAAPTPTPVAVPTDEEILAQAQNPDAVKRALDAERDNVKKAKARAKELEDQLAAAQDEAIPLEEKARLADERANEAVLKAARLEAAAKAGIPLNLAERLKGATAEELLADAETFKSQVSVQPRVLSEGGIRTDAPADKPDPIKDHNGFLLGVLSGGGTHGDGVDGGKLFEGLEPATAE